MEPKRPSYLRQKRKELGLRSGELAYKLGMHVQSISMIEYAKCACGEKRARRFAEFFEDDWKKFISLKE